MLAFLVITCLAAAAAAAGQGYQRSTTPVPILRQVSTSNDDGSYTYGYEAADGSFRLETRTADGDVTGKYGYRDANGELRTVEYGANRLGFQPAGKGITVAPPTLVDETKQNDYNYNQNSYNSNRNANNQYNYNYNTVPAAPAPVAAPSPAFQRQFSDFDSKISGYFSSSRGGARHSAPAPVSAPPTQARSYWETPQYKQAADIAHNVDYKTGSYSFDYVGRK